MLDSSISDHEIKINGYDIIRKDRNRHSGGVAIYLRKSLNYTVRDDLTDESLETLTLEITKPKARLFIVNSWYRLRNSSQECLDTYENLITQIDYKN
jgi:exonuclease III